MCASALIAALPFSPHKHICAQCVLGSQATEKMGAPGIECVIDIARQYHGKVPLAVASSGNKVPDTLAIACTHAPYHAPLYDTSKLR